MKRKRTNAWILMAIFLVLAVSGCGSQEEPKKLVESPCMRYPLVCEKPGSGATPQEYEKAKAMADKMTPQEYEAYVKESKEIEARQTR